LSVRIRLSLKLKLILLISVLLLTALGAYTFFAVDLFQKDKEAYVYESALNTIDQLQGAIQRQYESLGQSVDLINQISESSNREQLIEQILSESNQLNALLIKNLENNEIEQFSKEDFLEQLQLDHDEWSEIVLSRFHSALQSPPLTPDISFSSDSYISSELPFGSIVHYDRDTNKLVIVFFDLASLHTALGQQRVFDLYIQTPNGEVSTLVANHQLAVEIVDSFLQAIFEDHQVSANQGVRALQDPIHGEEYLVGYLQESSQNLRLLAVIPTNLAFSASRYLVRQSFLVSLLVLSLAVVIGILFSKTLTSQLEELYQATLRIAKGDFTTRVATKGSDEINALGVSFNDMSEKILVYMDEMKEKQRLESELAVAKLVQDSFFPPSELSLNKLSLSSFYTPATECGGDWWGFIDRDDNAVIIIADATGHGVPAAFLTATLFSGVQTLDQLFKGKKYTLSSAETMGFLNETVCRAGKSVLLTAVVMIIDKHEATIEYTNASHLDPLILRIPKGEEPSKDHLLPLLGGKGPRLGHKRDADYTSDTMKLEPSDYIVMWTDGLTEVKNLAGKEWGSRKLYSSILSNTQQGGQLMRDAIVNDVLSFCDKTSFDDDVTLICAQWSPTKQDSSHVKG
jgi:phosphoserine phosphatase RsbU/P